MGSIDAVTLALAKAYAEKLLAGGTDLSELIESSVDDYLSNNTIATKSKAMTATTATIEPNILYRWGEVTALSISLSENVSSDCANEYMFEFTSGNTATELTLPDTISWVVDPDIKANKTYQCSILNGIGLIIGV